MAMATLGHPGDPDIRGLSADSRTVGPGFLFAALAGSRADGVRFVDEAIRRGAAAVLASDRAAAALRPLGVPIIADPNPRRRLAAIAARFHGPQPDHLVAVTGTSGKTSVAWFVREIWRLLGIDAGSLGTLGVIAPGLHRLLAHTTPEPITLHARLAELKQRRVEHVVLEASSHGLDQFRLDGLRLAAAAFTNLTQDHYDYHPTPAHYRRAKFRLFDALLPAGATAVLNADSPEYPALAAIAAARGLRVLGYGRAGRDLGLVQARAVAAGQTLVVAAGGREWNVRLPLAGTFQAHNALAAVGLVTATGTPVPAALDALPRLEGVPGRLQQAAVLANGARVYVDYAHKPDALETVLVAARALARGRLVLVFGCGGDRDRAKRPLMGRIAARLADRVYVTDDNPRSEDPGAIRRAILAACPDAVEVGDRAQAIEHAIAQLRDDDVLVVAGKGHEQGQIVGPITVPFDDVAVVRDIVANLKGGTP
ncbi:MAG: UDP-N-acetylmuramoyl-L-alanyl-D-glutamate--2,6-diaminopimelate ligase [Alphaproteobacteria bacterium]